MITTNDLPALVAALNERQPQARWSVNIDPCPLAEIPGLVAVALLTPEEAGSQPASANGPLVATMEILGDWHILPPGISTVEVAADAICGEMRAAVADHAARLARKEDALEALRVAVGDQPVLKGVTAEGVSRLVAAIQPADADEVKVRQVMPLTDDDTVVLLRAHKSWGAIARAVEAMAPIKLTRNSLMPGLWVRCDHAATLRLKSALSHLAAVAREWEEP